jgi:LacI family transcriptional regulator
MSNNAPSIQDVAARAGVALGTVSNVLNNPDLVSEKTRAKVQKAIMELGFVRNDAARQLRAGSSRSIGLIVPDVRNPFYTDVARGAEDAANEQNLSVLLANTDDELEREQAMLSLFEEQRVRGVLVSPTGDNLDYLKQAQKRGTGIVLVDRKSSDFSSVSVDDVAGGYLATKHLIECGRKHIAFVGGPLTVHQIADRLAGAKKAVAEHNDVTLEVVETKNLSVQSGRALGKLVEKFDGVFAANDLVAIGIMQACVVDGHVSIPRDLSLIGYDDIDFAAAAIVPLTSVRQPSAEIGKAAIELLISNHGKSKNIEFQPELVVRSSTLR